METNTATVEPTIEPPATVKPPATVESKPAGEPATPEGNRPVQDQPAPNVSPPNTPTPPPNSVAPSAPDAPPHGNAKRIAARVLGFSAATAAIWAGYFTWRPPLPMLYLKHIEHMGDSNKLSLTFDDAPHPLSTPLLLASLKRAEVKGTFFVVGEGLRLYPELSYRMVAEGHALANHSENHRNLTRADVPATEYDLEIKSCFRRMEWLGQNSKLFRPPGGGMNRAVMDYLYRNDYTLAWWSNNIGDWSRPPAWKIVDTVNMGVAPGDIILLHDAGIGTAQALPRIVRNAREQGLEFVTMPEE